MMVPLTLSELEQTAKEIRKDVLRMIYLAGSGHPGGSLSSVEILVALYFGGVLKFDHHRGGEEKDHFILSCGHVCPAWYAVLARTGVFNEQLLETLREFGSPLQGHPSLVHAGFVETSSGSLGQGLAVGAGKALAMKINKEKGKVVVLCSDGELDEGSVWETVMWAGFKQLDNLNLVIDRNQMQIGGRTEKVLDLEPLQEKFRSFGWEAYQCDGHDFGELLANFCNFNEQKRRPKVVICRTVRGKGISFMENSEKYHAGTLSEEEYQKAIEELE